MKKHIKDEIYHHPIEFVICDKEKLNSTIRNHYKRLSIEPSFDERDHDYQAAHIQVICSDNQVDTWIWINKTTVDKNWLDTVVSLAHELNHHVDNVFDNIKMQVQPGHEAITEARAYYFNYIQIQILRFIYKK